MAVTPEANRRYRLKSYYKNRELEISRQVPRTRDREKRLALLSREARNKPCADCRVSYPWWVMEFDHVRGVKEADVSVLVRRGVAVRRIQAEIEKCDVVCSNCHRQRTFQRIGAEPISAWVVQR